MQGSNKFIVLILFSLAVADWGVPALCAAELSEPVKFDIQPQSLDTALLEFSKQAGIQIFGPSRSVTGRTTPGIQGKYIVEQALQTLLQNSGLTYRQVNSRTVAIGPQSGESAQLGTEDYRMAQGPQASTVPPGIPAEQQQDTQKIEEIIVTAQKRKERLIDVPMSIVAVSADELQRRQINSLDDLPYAVPDLSYGKQGNSYIFEIRGVSNISGTTPLVGLYIDEADVTLGGSFGVQVVPVTYDLDRVEVLRGPQGTLYGEGSAGGTIRFITKNPDLTRIAFDAHVAAQFTENGDPSQRINAMVNVPLIENQLGLRIAGTYGHDGGWIDQPAADQKHINGQDLTNVRIKGLWQPAPDLTVSAMAVISRDDGGMDFSDVQSPNSWTQVFNLTNTPRIRNDHDLYNLTITYDLSSVARILSTTSYLRESAPQWNLGFTDQLNPPPEMPYSIYTPFTQNLDHLLTNELRLTSIGSGRWQWTVGGFFRHYRDLSGFPTNYFDLPGPSGTPLSAYFHYSYGIETLYKSWSTFGDTSYQLSDRLTVGAGVRYFGEKQDFTDFSDPTAIIQQTGRFHSIDPRAYTQFKLTPNVNVYASAAKGFRSGGFNSFSQPTFGPESVWTYELGAKMAFLEGRVSFDTALYWSNYTDYQIYGLVGALSYYSNAGRARIKGVEGSVTWRPLSQWRLEARGNYLDDRFTEIKAAGTAYAVGDPLDGVPRYQFTISGQHDFSYLGKQGFVALDYNQQGPKTYRNRNINGPSPWFYAESDVIQMLNLHASLTLNDNLRVGFLAQNLLNDQGFVNALWYFGNGARSRPRTFGIDFNVTFN